MGLNVRYLCEPVLLLYAFGFMLQSPTVHQYVYHRYSNQQGFHSSYTERTFECKNGSMTSSQRLLQEKAQSLTAWFSVLYTLCSTAPTVIMCLFYGALSDIVGRRCIILVVLVMSLIEANIILSTIYFSLPIPVIFIGNMCSALGGGLNAMFMLIIAYVADVTEKSERSSRIGIVEACLFLGMTLSHYSSGWLIHVYGFSCPQAIAVCCHFVALLYSLFVLKETRSIDSKCCTTKSKEERDPMYYIFFQQPRNMFRILTKRRPNRALLYLAIIILISGLSFAISIHPVFTLYLLNRPFCWPALDIGYIMGTYFLVLSFGTVFGMKVLTKCIPEWVLSIMGYIFASGSFLLLAFARNSLDLYGAVFVRMFGGLPTAIFRGIISRNVEENEQGAIFSVVTSLEIILVFLGTFAFNFSYERLNAHGHPGWFFFVPAVLILIPFCLALLYWKKSLLSKTETVGDEEQNESSINLLDAETEEKEVEDDDNDLQTRYFWDKKGKD